MPALDFQFQANAPMKRITRFLVGIVSLLAMLLLLALIAVSIVVRTIHYPAIEGDYIVDHRDATFEYGTLWYIPESQGYQFMRLSQWQIRATQIDSGQTHFLFTGPITFQEVSPRPVFVRDDGNEIIYITEDNCDEDGTPLGTFTVLNKPLPHAGILGD